MTKKQAPEDNQDLKVLKSEADIAADKALEAIGTPSSSTTPSNPQVDPIQGHVFDNDDEVAVSKALNKIEVEQKYGDQNLRTAAESALSAATLGISDKALVESGLVDAEDLAGRREANPFASGVGSVGGLAASLAFPGGAAAKAAQAATTTGKVAATAGKVASTATALPRVAQAAGKTAETALANVIKKYGKDSTVHNIIKQTIAKGAGGAVEGGFYGVGHLISENALNDVELSVENLVSNIGMGALLGGATSSGLVILPALGSVAGKKIASGTKQVRESLGKSLGPKGEAMKAVLKEKSEKLTDANSLMGDILGWTPSRRVNWEKNPDLYDNVASWTHENLKIKNIQRADHFLNQLKNVEKRTANAANKLFEEVDSKVSTPAYKLYQDMLSTLKGVEERNRTGYMNKLIKDFRKKVHSKEILPDSAPHAKYGRTYKLVPNVGLAEKSKNLLELRRQIDEVVNWGDKKTADHALIKIREQINNTLKDIAEKNIPGGGAQFRKINYDIRMTKRLIDDVMKKEAKGGGKSALENVLDFKNLGLAILGHGIGGIEVAGTIAAGKALLESEMVKRARIIHALEKAGKKNDEAVKGYVSKFFEGAKNATGTTLKPVNRFASKYGKDTFRVSLINSELSKPYDDTKKKPKNRMEAFQTVSNNLSRLKTEPELLEKLIGRKILPMYEAAPRSAMTMIDTAVRGIDFLASKLPKPLTERGMFRKHEFEPSEIQLRKFERYLTAVNNPMSVIEDFAAGTLTREGAEALQVVYPKIFQGLQQTVLAYGTEKNIVLPLQKRIQVGILLDIPSDISLQPKHLAALQQSFADQAESEQDSQASQAPSQSKATPARADKLDRASREETKQNRIAQR
jgi:hypothetical protein